MYKNPKIKKALDEMTMYDHDLMQAALDGNREAAQNLFRIILPEENFMVKTVKCEVEYTGSRIGAKKCKLDVFAEDERKATLNYEMQTIQKRFPPQRSRGYISRIDSGKVKEGEAWHTMTDTIHIVQFAHDPFGKGEPIYTFEMKDQNGETLKDGARIMYVNGDYMDMNTLLGRLNHDLKCKNPNDMCYDWLREIVRKQKETQAQKDEGGDRKMLGQVVEEYGEECRNEGRLEGKLEGKLEGAITGSINTAKSLGITGVQLIETVMKSCDTTEDVVKQYLAAMK